MRRIFVVLLVVVMVASIAAACGGGDKETPTPEAVNVEGGLPASAMEIASARGLTPDDINAALKTFVPSGKMDEYMLFLSGGHSGNVIAVGVPSMRIMKNIAVFTPESWQGYGYGSKESEEILDAGNVNGVKIRMGDTHHPALSETGGDYDGQYLFINDKSSARVAVIDLRDFETKQIVKDPLLISQHGSTFVTPNTDYVIQASQYGTPLGWDYAPISEYKEKYRGTITMWKFDREKGRIIPEESFAIEVPPYWQDLCDAGKLASDGWGFCNSFNSELATGGVEEGNPPFEAGVSQRDTDYLHIFNWKKAAEVVAAGKAETINGMQVIRIPTAVEEGVLFLAPEPKSPHGVDVTPDGKYMVVAGKLDPHVTIYAMDKIQKAIDAGKWTTDDFGIPVLNFDDVMMAQVELGLGPLHTQFDDKGNAYTSLFLDSAVARWKLGGDDPAAYQLLDKLSVQYNIGHISAAEGDTVSPDGKYLVALNKWAVDRFPSVGPLLPQNEQLLDISGNPMQVIYDMPMGVGEPHYAQMIKMDKLHPWDVYPQVGWDPVAQAPSEFATAAGEEKVVRDGNEVEVWMTAVRSHLTPEHVQIKKGDHVTWHITNIETAKDATHGFQLGGYNISLSIEPGETTTFEFDAVNDGTYAYYCTEFCSALHLEMMGYMLVEP
ncbi:MAG: Sec-dependent nitrous-oxide reductase [Caldilinea sp.]|nr:Sec-dependent nitrous-oxide reductase [Caldilinea sp.]MCB0135845.1 Sec-dependent nitrous-oxide reductase [Caldilineaceae bacterium]MCB0146347.1 Sec-dependent nitrous-oxide reductase [Caldilineaceae bacterium]MCO5209037.1 Sec-dependent nitrous-oxide reductase [Caldilinea sp.]MCW5841618.1 Sec-dependent nitrous-oxide reductase [Caldilinea sp.]